MTDFSEHDFRTTELNQDLLSTPYKVQTNWHIIAGSPSSGKTTLIDQLANKGVQTVQETARLLINREIAKGRTIEEIRRDQISLQHRIIDLQIRIERDLLPDKFLILDRGIPDHFVYCRVAELNPNEFLADCFHHRYASIFILAPLPFHSDGARDRDANLVKYMDDWTTRDYRALGYDIIRVPVLPPEKRLAFVLERLPKITFGIK